MKKMMRLVSAMLSFIIAFSAVSVIPTITAGAAEGIFEYNVEVVDFDADLGSGQEKENLEK